MGFGSRQSELSVHVGEMRVGPSAPGTVWGLTGRGTLAECVAQTTEGQSLELGWHQHRHLPMKRCLRGDGHPENPKAQPTVTPPPPHTHTLLGPRPVLLRDKTSSAAGGGCPGFWGVEGGKEVCGRGGLR
uniref:Uncharacterized protein n=1 Tax=Pipistrellus kuhlii TaxID=59472 RepID=A0A7J7UG66_PIPKU|nr:hypothetical protein mPipKuh1_009067 [Pipistrellus kuhlii]